MTEFDVTPEWDRKKGPRPAPETVERMAETGMGQAEAEETDDDMPADAEPSFIIVRNAYGPGAHSVKFPDGTAVGVWMRAQNLTPDEVHDRLTNLGLDDDLVAFFVRTRAAGIEADKSLSADPIVAAFSTEEDRRRAAKEETKAAFLAAYNKKKGKA